MSDSITARSVKREARYQTGRVWTRTLFIQTFQLQSFYAASRKTVEPAYLVMNAKNMPAAVSGNIRLSSAMHLLSKWMTADSGDLRMISEERWMDRLG